MTISPLRDYAVIASIAFALLPGGTAFAQKAAPVPATERNAEIAMERGNFASAIAISTKLISQKPKRFVLYLRRGIAYYQIGRYDKAALDFSSFIKLRPALVEGYLNRAYAYKEMGKYKEALADLDKVESMDKYRADTRLRGQILSVMPTP